MFVTLLHIFKFTIKISSLTWYSSNNLCALKEFQYIKDLNERMSLNISFLGQTHIAYNSSVTFDLWVMEWCNSHCRRPTSCVCHREARDVRFVTLLLNKYFEWIFVQCTDLGTFFFMNKTIAKQSSFCHLLLVIVYGYYISKKDFDTILVIFVMFAEIALQWNCVITRTVGP